MTNGILNNKYRILRQIGSGKSGVTYLAQPVDHPDERVLIKESPHSRNKAEESILKKVSAEEPAIQRFLESFSDNNRYFQVFEYLPDAISLRQLIDEQAPLEEIEAIRYGLKIAKALKTLHAFGLVHGDIKPSNILFANGQQIKLIDLEIASLNGKKRTLRIGTEQYAAPEQYHGIVNFKSDIYSLGVVLYEMLTGRRSQARFSFKPVRIINPKVSLKLANVIQRCLELEQEKRPSTDELYNFLQTLSQNRDN